MSATTAITTEAVLDDLRRLPPRERLRVIAQALPELERELQELTGPLESLRGLWKDLDFDISAEEIDEARREAWADFPREDIHSQPPQAIACYNKSRAMSWGKRPSASSSSSNSRRASGVPKEEGCTASLGGDGASDGVAV